MGTCFDLAMLRRSRLVVMSAGMSVLACSRWDNPRSDAALPFMYTVATTADEPLLRPARIDRPIVFIDGIAQAELDVSYASFDAAYGASHKVELRDGDAVVAGLTLPGRDVEDCVRPEGVLITFVEHVCELDSGDLRLFEPSGSIERSDGALETCDIDGSASCNPRCTATSCAGGQHCTSIVTSQTPLFSHVGCAPIGDKQIGSACAYATGSDGSYDDCSGGSVCVNGICRALCSGSCTSCDYIEGEPPELMFCT